MKCLNFLLRLLAVAGMLVLPVTPAFASIDSMNLGASYNSSSSSLTFRVYSAHATQIWVCLYNAGWGQAEVVSYPLQATSTPGVWALTEQVSALTSAGVTGTIYYGYRAWGPNWPYNSNWAKGGSSAGYISDVDQYGNRFNPNKLLIDPYALELSQDPLNKNNYNDENYFASGTSAIAYPGTSPVVVYRTIDSGPYAPKGIVLPVTTPTSTGTKPTGAQTNDVIYEVHVRGLTAQDPSIATEYQGTYKGAGMKASYLASLGITAIEFLPVAESQNDANNHVANSDSGDGYWGYGNESYFAPDRHYAYDQSPGGPTAEFQAMVAAFHAQGIKVYLDVVYNHTYEGGLFTSSDPNTTTLLSWRGLDNSTYYELSSDNQNYFDVTGTGANFNTYNTVAQNLIVDSLAYWTNTMGIDGYRFDLGAVLGNACLSGASGNGSAPNCPNGGFLFDANDSATALNRITSEFTVRPYNGGSGLDLIAEPWTATPSYNYLGQFPKGWSNWNGTFRDTFRQVQNDQQSSSTPALSQVQNNFTGSPQLFNTNSRSPYYSINYMDIHDGFTLNDVYSCNGSYNTQGWPYGPSPAGSTTNYSWDQGESAGTGTAADQRRAARTGLLFTLLSAGTPMIQGGDESLRTLDCNNNAYNVDSYGNWLTYSASWSTAQSDFYTFAQRAIAFRKAHKALRPASFYTSSQITWYEPSGAVATSAYVNNTNGTNYAIAYLLNKSNNGDANTIYVAYNGYSGSVNFTLPAPPSGTSWYRVTDTCNWNETSNGANVFLASGDEQLLNPETSYSQCAESALLLIAK